MTIRIYFSGNSLIMYINEYPAEMNGTQDRNISGSGKLIQILVIILVIIYIYVLLIM